MKYFDKYSPFDKKGSFTIASTETGVTPVGQESETFRHHREADTCKQHIIIKNQNQCVVRDECRTATNIPDTIKIQKANTARKIKA